MKKALFLLLSAMAGSSLSFANLLTNGDFETVDDRVGLANVRRLDQLNPGQWDVFSALPGGWNRLNGTGIEVQANNTLSGVTAESGNLYVELDSHPNNTNGGSTNSTMGQSYNFSAGNYILSFYFRPRTNTTNDNGIQVRLGSTVLLNVDGTTGVNSNWQLFSKSFNVAVGGVQNVIFEATGTANQLGGFVDTVSLVRDPNQGTGEVPEPSTLALIGGALVALAVRRRSKA